MPRISLLAPVCPCCGNEDVVLLDAADGQVVLECHFCCLLSVVEIGWRAVDSSNAEVAAT